MTELEELKALLKLLWKSLCFLALIYLILPLTYDPNVRAELSFRAFDIKTELDNLKRQNKK